MASLVAANFLQILPAFPIGTFTHFSHLSHFLYPSSIPGAWEIAPATSPRLYGSLNVKCQSRRPWMTPTIVRVLMSSPSSCATAHRKPDTRHQLSLCVHAQERLCSHGRGQLGAMATTTAHGPR